MPDFVSIHMQRTESSSYQEETQTTLQLWTLSMEPASRHKSGAKNLGWLLDFCELYEPLFYAFFSYASSHILSTESFYLFVCIFISVSSAALPLLSQVFQYLCVY